MRPPTPNSTETSLGASYVREDLLKREARNNPVARWIRKIARVALVLMVVGVLAAIAVGPGEAIGWIGAYLVPVVVVLAVIIAALALLVWVVKRLPESSLRDWYQ